LFAPALVLPWLFELGELGFAELLPTALVLPDVPVAELSIVLLWFVPVLLFAGF
jgi:hypothetical protein